MKLGPNADIASIQVVTGTAMSQCGQGTALYNFFLVGELPGDSQCWLNLVFL